MPFGIVFSQSSLHFVRYAKLRYVKSMTNLMDKFDLS